MSNDNLPDLKIIRTRCQDFAKLHLTACCAELLEWQDTAILCDGRVRELAALCNTFVGNHDGLRVAESFINRAAVEAQRDAVAASGAGVPAKRWPFVETPGEFAKRMAVAINMFGGDVLAACRHCLIENPATLSAAPTHDRDGGAVIHPSIERYEYVRCLHPADFEKLVSANIAGVGKFDDLVDKAIAAKLAR